MRALLQRVKYSRVSVDGEEVSRIGPGLLLLLGVAADDEEKDLEWLVDKVINLRVFDDVEGKMNLSLTELGGEIMVVSQFTLCADARKGRRPSYTQAAAPGKRGVVLPALPGGVTRPRPRSRRGSFRRPYAGGAGQRRPRHPAARLPLNLLAKPQPVVYNYAKLRRKVRRKKCY